MFAGFDLGAKLGYAFVDISGYRVDSGTLRLGKRSPESTEKAYLHLVRLFEKHHPSIVGYEKVTFFGRGYKAAHAYGTYEGVLWLVATETVSILEQFTVKEIKKVATGFTNATKDEVGAAVLARWAYLTIDDNEADALWIAECARRRFISGSI